MDRCENAEWLTIFLCFDATGYDRNERSIGLPETSEKYQIEREMLSGGRRSSDEFGNAKRIIHFVARGPQIVKTAFRLLLTKQ